MNQSDMNERGLAKGDLVDITSHHEGHTRKAEQFTVIPYPIPRTCVATYFPKANVFVPIDSVTDKEHPHLQIRSRHSPPPCIIIKRKN